MFIYYLGCLLPLEYKCFLEDVNTMGYCCSVAKSGPTLCCDSTDGNTPGFPVLHYLWSLLQLMSIELVMPFSSSHLLLLLPSVFPRIRVFSSELALHIKWPKYWSFSFSLNPSNEQSHLISFRIDWFDLLTVQGTLKSLLQHHNSKASVLPCSALFMLQLSYLYMSTGKTIALIYTDLCQQSDDFAF